MHTVRIDWPDTTDALRQALATRLPPGVFVQPGEIEPPPTTGTRYLVAGRPTDAQLDGLGSQDGLIIPFAGVPASTLAALRTRPWLRAWNLHHNARAVAESALGLALAAGRGIVPADRALRAHDWQPRYAPDATVLLAGGTALLFGFGAIGRALAPMLTGLGMHVRAIRRDPAARGVEGAVELLPPAALLDALPTADLVVVCAPSTEETRGVFDAGAFARMRTGAVFVNVARADLVDPQALYDALVHGPLFGAGIDVWWDVPASVEARGCTPPSHLPFYELPNIAMSPHRAAHARSTEDDRMLALARLLTALIEAPGEAPRPIDPALGY